ncbi:MAG TPA: hypothetical protein VJU78_19095 [Chitinophagaceae bacterium]|nr:hypothetical protein [Chitinophagaceae bacterium]
MKINHKFSIFIIVWLPFIACKQKEKSNQEKFFPVLSFIQSQVADIDTSLYSIRKLVYVDSIRTDTIFIPREQFREAAKDFLSIPDLSSSEYDDRYKEEKQFDETMNRVVLTYTPLKPGKEEIQRQEVLIKPDPSGDKITNIIINQIINTKDSSVQKRLLWKVDESFQIINTKQLKGQPETTSTVKIVWGENE